MSEYQFKTMLYRCVTPLHIGCGQDVGVVDLPVIRERTTGYPYMPGSGIRGVFRDKYEGINPDEAKILFGKELEEMTAGCVSVVDAHLLLFPVRSSHNVFCWITCPFVLKRYKEEVGYFGTEDPAWEVPPSPDDTHYYGLTQGDTSLYLEEYKFSRGGDFTFPITIPGKENPSVVYVSDRTFFQMVNQATIVTQHNKLNSAKTVEGTALFSVEAVPAESVFYGFVGATQSRTQGNTLSGDKVMRKLTEALPSAKSLFFGGHESIGFGLTSLTWL